MKIALLSGALIVWILSFTCILTTINEVSKGKYGIETAEFRQGVLFHGITAIAALWMFVYAI